MLKQKARKMTMRNCNNCFWLRTAGDGRHTWKCKEKGKFMEFPSLHGWFCRLFRRFGRKK